MNFAIYRTPCTCRIEETRGIKNPLLSRHTLHNAAGHEPNTVTPSLFTGPAETWSLQRFCTALQNLSVAENIEHLRQNDQSSTVPSSLSKKLLGRAQVPRSIGGRGQLNRRNTHPRNPLKQSFFAVSVMTL